MYGRCRLDHRPHASFVPSPSHPLFSYLNRYIVYGPLLNGATATVFESTPVYPAPSRCWQVVEQHNITQFYTAPTAVHLLRRLGEHHTQAHDLSTIRVLGSIGEPINPEARDWYDEHSGKRQCAIVDTWWQTETGSIITIQFPSAIETKPGSATVPSLASSRSFSIRCALGIPGRPLLELSGRITTVTLTPT